MKTTLFLIFAAVTLLSKTEATGLRLEDEERKGFLQKINQQDYPNAKCIDGTAPAYYIFEGRSTKKVIIYLNGGGVCSNPTNCFARSLTGLGSSKDYPPTITEMNLNGLLSRNTTINPGFSDFSIIHVPYCDGNLYSGMREEPYMYQHNPLGQHFPLWFRGAYNLQAVVDHVSTTLFNRFKVEEVIISGGSAGGYGTFLHSDSVLNIVTQNVPTVRKTGAIPLSGFFPVALNAEGQNDIAAVLVSTVELANTTGSLNPACLAAQRAAGKPEFECIRAAKAYNFSTAPTFVSESTNDMWQLCNELAGTASTTSDPAGINVQLQGLSVPLYAGQTCLGMEEINKKFPYSGCNVTQIKPILDWQFNVLDLMNTTAGFKRAHNGAFIISCYKHVAGQASAFWYETKVRGVSMHDAAWQWWQSVPDVNSSEKNEAVEDSSSSSSFGPNTYIDCLRTMDNAPTSYECNPTCANGKKLDDEDDGLLGWF